MIFKFKRANFEQIKIQCFIVNVKIVRKYVLRLENTNVRKCYLRISEFLNWFFFLAVRCIEDFGVRQEDV